ncbi:uncharacterized protein LOC129267746 [Lytechinus pictus]|uniref:uncharacterized protein LOC129267746 n=1 Tax=Lytechinus pictus TaxID=7653 RepID=UPI0030BA0F52
MNILVPFLVLLSVLSGIARGSSPTASFAWNSSSSLGKDDYATTVWTTPEIRLPPLEARLVNGPDNTTGRVEVHYNGTWGTVCDDGWDLNDAHVVCRMVGFYRASSAPVMARYGPGSGVILLDEVWCRGSENSLEECSKNDYGVHNCVHSEDAGAICETTEEEDDVTWSWSAIEIDWPVYQPEIWIPSTRSSERYLEARLVGPNDSSGRVEILYNGTWGTVCDDGWDLNDAHVVCRMLGFPKASSAPVMATYGEGTVDILLDDVQCSGSEYSLEDCRKKKYWVHNCEHKEDAGIVCTEPVPLQVRLANGPNNNIGRVEVMMNQGHWGTVCDDFWDPQDANVVCRMLGFFGAAYAPVRATYGEGQGDILLQNVDCMGTEHKLETCFYDTPQLYDCAHDEDASAACLDFISGFDLSLDSSLNGTLSLQCPDIESSTDKGRDTSSNVTIRPVVHHGGNDNVSVGCTYTSQHAFVFGDTWVACAVRDDVGNYATCNFTVTIRDDDPPQLDCPEFINATTDRGSRYASNVIIDPRVSDNTDPNPSVSCSPGSPFPYGNHSVTCAATDLLGNNATCSITVSVTDKDPPQITCADRQVVLDAEDPSNFIPDVTDNIDRIPSIECFPGYFDELPLGGDPTIRCNASDSEGNTATCNFTLTVQDPCTARPCVNGDCTYLGSGNYQCSCFQGYEGTHCDVIHKPKLPVEVNTRPQNKKVQINSPVALTCSFNNAASYEWYKDDSPLPNMADKTTLRIQSVNTSHIGYYFCRGYGDERSSSIDTETASIYIEGLVTIKVSKLRFHLDGISSSQTPSTIRDFVIDSLKNRTNELRLTSYEDLSPEVICNPSSFNQQGTDVVNAEVTVYMKNTTSLTAVQERDLVTNALTKAASISNGFLDVSSMDTENTGEQLFLIFM